MSKSGVCPHWTHWTQAGGRFSHRPGFLTALLSLSFKVRLYSDGRLYRHPQNCYSAMQAQRFSPTDSDSCNTQLGLWICILKQVLWDICCSSHRQHFEKNRWGGERFGLCLSCHFKRFCIVWVHWSVHVTTQMAVLSEGSEASLSGFHQEDSYVFNHGWMEKTLCSFHMNYFEHFIGSACVWINITSLRHCGARSINNWYHSFKLYIFIKIIYIISPLNCVYSSCFCKWNLSRKTLQGHCFIFNSFESHSGLWKALSNRCLFFGF